MESRRTAACGAAPLLFGIAVVLGLALHPCDCSPMTPPRESSLDSRGGSVDIHSRTKELSEESDINYRRHLRLADENRNRRAVSAFRDLELSDVCFIADDCDPGLFEVEGMATQCERTPFSVDETICCKPFATPCDSDEACCSGWCNGEYTRCTDPTSTQATSSNTSDPPLTTSAGVTASSANSQTQPSPVSVPSPTSNLSIPPGGNFSENSPMQDAESSSVSSEFAGLSSAGSRDDAIAPSPLGSANEEDEGSSSTASVDQQSSSTKKSKGGDAVQCNLSYASGTITTVVKSDVHVRAVTVDSQGNVFYAVGDQSGADVINTIRRVADTSSSTSTRSDVTLSDDNNDVVFEGTGLILALAVDADDSLVFGMADKLGQTGRIYSLSLTSSSSPSSSELPPAASGYTTPSSFEGDKRGSAGGFLSTESAGAGGTSSGSSLDGTVEAIPLSVDGLDLGPFIPGIAVCPVTGDIYVARGHSGLSRILKSDNFSTQVHWQAAEIVFEDGDDERAPSMIWDVAVDSTGVVYVTTYLQGVVLKGIFPADGGTPTVKHAAGTWDSGVSASSGDGGRAIQADLALPKGIAVGDSNSVYVTEFRGAKVRSVTTSGIISTSVGTGEKDYTGDGGSAVEATLDMPNAVAFALGQEGGPLVIADFGNNAVRVVVPSCV